MNGLNLKKIEASGSKGENGQGVAGAISTFN